MRRQLILGALALTACSREQRDGLLELTVFKDDGSTYEMSVEEPTRWDETLIGTQGARASWPYADDITADTEDYLVVDFRPGRVGAFEAAVAELRFDGGQVLSNVGAGGLMVTVERLRWNDDARFPFTHEGRLEGFVGMQQVEGTFTVDHLSCESEDQDSTLQCGALWPATDQDALQVDLISFSQDDCPAAVRDLYLDGAEATFGRKSFQVGAAETLDCVDTGPGSVGELTSGEETFEAGPYVCGGNAEVEAEGCTWSVSAWARWRNAPGDVLAFGVEAAIIDGSCDHAECAALLSASQVTP
ncbi:MAG: hypothetical protein H6739_39160 [Alphaproteobacteria bacterium]|nr:hypothetical protein [Alphaproteobacteria bacterium]